MTSDERTLQVRAYSYLSPAVPQSRALTLASWILHPSLLASAEKCHCTPTIYSRSKKKRFQKRYPFLPVPFQNGYTGNDKHRLPVSKRYSLFPFVRFPVCPFVRLSVCPFPRFPRFISPCLVMIALFVLTLVPASWRYSSGQSKRFRLFVSRTIVIEIPQNVHPRDNLLRRTVDKEREYPYPSMNGS